MFLELENQVKIAVGCIYFQKEIESFKHVLVLNSG